MRTHLNSGKKNKAYNIVKERYGNRLPIVSDAIKYRILAIKILESDKKEIDSIQFKVLSTKATNLDIFDVIYEKDLVTAETGYIHQDYDVYVDDITVSDKLKQALIQRGVELPEEYLNEEELFEWLTKSYLIK